MKKWHFILCILAILSLTITAFEKREVTAALTIKQRYQSRQADLENNIQLLLTNLTQYGKGSITLLELKEQYLKLRKAYKEWEYLGEYLDPQFVKDNLNPAPLPKLERNSFGMMVIQPKGMQVIDDIIYSENINDQQHALSEQLTKMAFAVKEHKEQNPEIYDRVVIEAFRTELVRIYTLGLTGFDVPGSGNAVADAIVSFQIMENDIQLYKSLFESVNPLVSKKFYTTLTRSIKYLKANNSFDTLDRLYFLKEFVNPLYSDLLILHKESGIEFIHEVTANHLLPPYNNLSNNLFANDFLDHFKYIGLPKNLYNESLVDLGRTLFFDPVLSSNNKRSCASCHNPSLAFTDGLPKSTASDFDGTVERNSPGLINCVYNERFFHDMRSEALEDQIEHVLTSRKEFNTDMLEIIKKLKSSEEYQQLFIKALKDYPGEKISSQGITFALSAYVSSLRGFNSPFDKYVRGETTIIGNDVVRGYNLFMGKAACGTCHFAPVFNGTVPPRYEESESEVLGVPANPYVKYPVIDPDLGRAKGRLKENVPFFAYSFKTPTVRNVALTAPYMHNGAYKTLEDVMDFYNKGGGDGLNIKLEHQTLPFDSLSLSKREISDIVAFMKALTDTSNMTRKPAHLPLFTGKIELNTRRIGGEY